jgi:hypothetical protein
VTFRVQFRGISGCIVFEDWSERVPPHDTLEEALAYATRELEGGTCHAIRVLADDGTVTKVQKQQATVIYTDGDHEPWLPPEQEDE